MASRTRPVGADRSPTDYLAYLTALQPETTFVDRVAQTCDPLSTLGLIVFGPIEKRDVIETGVAETPSSGLHTLR